MKSEKSPSSLSTFYFAAATIPAILTFSRSSEQASFWPPPSLKWSERSLTCERRRIKTVSNVTPMGRNTLFAGLAAVTACLSVFKGSDGHFNTFMMLVYFKIVHMVLKSCQASKVLVMNTLLLITAMALVSSWLRHTVRFNVGW